MHFIDFYYYYWSRVECFILRSILFSPELSRLLDWTYNCDTESLPHQWDFNRDLPLQYVSTSLQMTIDFWSILYVNGIFSQIQFMLWNKHKTYKSTKPPLLVVSGSVLQIIPWSVHLSSNSMNSTVPCFNADMMSWYPSPEFIIIRLYCEGDATGQGTNSGLK